MMADLPLRRSQKMAEPSDPMVSPERSAPSGIAWISRAITMIRQ